MVLVEYLDHTQNAHKHRSNGERNGVGHAFKNPRNRGGVGGRRGGEDDTERKRNLE